jgi:hypothetical protein
LTFACTLPWWKLLGSATRAAEQAAAGRVGAMLTREGETLAERAVAKSLAGKAAGRMAAELEAAGGGRLFRTTTAELERIIESPTSIKQLQQKLGRAGLIDSQGVRIVLAAESEIPRIPGLTIWGWVEHTGRQLLTDDKGRVIVKLAPEALQSLKQAVITVGHELHHVRELLAGTGANEALAERAGLAMFEALKRFLHTL